MYKRNGVSVTFLIIVIILKTLSSCIAIIVEIPRLKKIRSDIKFAIDVLLTRDTFLCGKSRVSKECKPISLILYYIMDKTVRCPHKIT